MKLTIKEDAYDVGVIVGRFQVPELHEAHLALIQHVCDAHDKVVIFLGLSPLMVTRENPLDFESRKQMLLAAFPNVNVLYIKDTHSDELWSRRLDEMVGDVLTPSQTAVLYGGRDSFIKHYIGRYAVRELEQDVWISGNEIRKAVSTRSVKGSPDFRAGVVWAAYSQFPTVYPTVDIAIMGDSAQRMLLGRKPTETAFRFIGGFVDPNKDPSYESAARRETMEEVGVDITDPVYVASIAVNDWRYRNEVDRIITTLFIAHYRSGVIRPGDDIVEAKWFDLDTITPNDIVETHWPLLSAIRRYTSQDPR